MTWNCSQPGVFYAGYASSAVVQASTDFWAYFEPIRQFMPQNCSSDVQAVINYVDGVFTNGTQEDIQKVLDNFGLGVMSHLDDAVGACKSFIFLLDTGLRLLEVRNNLWTWQSLQPTTGSGSAFFEFCDAIEVKDGQKAGVSGWGVQHALSAWGTYWNTTYYSQCKSSIFVSGLQVTTHATN